MSTRQRTLSAFTVALLLALMSTPAFAEKRIALVIGNGAYKTSTTLRNPPNDAADVSAALRAVGFTVTTLIDGKREAMEKAVRDFGNSLKDPDAVGLFYYSGHGAQVDGANYLLPVDADIQAEDELAYKAVNAEAVLAKMRSAGNRLNIVVMDACRNNPFPGSTRSADKGLAVVRVKVPESIIVYATDPGAVAQDGDGRNSPFTTAFIAQLAVPGQEISVALRRVTGEVKDATGGTQTPWVSSNYTSDFAFRPGSAVPTPSAVSATPSTTPSFGAVKAATGNLSIQLACPGTVSVAGLSAAVPAGTVPVNDLAAGSQTVTVRYADGKSESRTVTVPAGGTASVSFTYTPPAPTPAAAAEQATSSGSAAAKAGSAAPGRTYRNEVWVEGGSFRMGSDSGDSDEKPVHTVSVSGFYIMSTEVTQKDYTALMGTNPSNFKGDSLPVEQVSWYDAVAYANKLSQKDGLTPAYTISGTNVAWNKGANGWRLPTEAEWEYAALGGPKAQGLAQSAVYAGSADLGSVAWYDGNSGNKTHQVATKAPNTLGLYDMSGNVWEWTNDWYGSYGSGGQTDPMGASSGEWRVLRGGSWLNNDYHARSARRGYYFPVNRDSSHGFRLVRRP
jgi:formylglycine-generating enzyme required for sulfatase activity